MKKILFIIWSYSLGGGAEALLTTIVNRLNPQKYEIGIIEFYHSAVKEEPVNANIRIYDPVTFEGDREYQKKMYYAYYDPDQMIRKYIPAGYDLYVSFNYQVPSFLLPEGERNIAWVHGAVSDLAETGMEGHQYLQGKAFEKADKIIAISDVTAYSIRKLFPEHADKIVEIYNAVDIERVRDKAACYTAVKLQHPAVVCVGRLDNNKNPLRAVEIFRGLTRRIGAAHLYFLGKGDLEKQVEHKAEAYGLKEQIHVLGYVENPFPVVKQADVCCMTSKSEGFPLSLLESVALGIPFVSTEVGGAKILSNDGRCGRVYKTNEEAASLIVEFLRMQKEEVVKECEKFIHCFGLRRYISKIEELFDEVLRLKVDPNRKRVWEKTQSANELEDRNYYYHFSENLVSKNSRVILYGAGDIGTNYYHYIKETGLFQVVAWVDAMAGNYRNAGKEVQDIDAIFRVEYDVVLIAVMAERVSKEIRINLSQRGIPEDKIVWTKPIL